MRIVVYHNAAHWDDCGGVEVWLEPEGRNAEEDFDAYPGTIGGIMKPARTLREEQRGEAPTCRTGDFLPARGPQ
jgi:hypothetical protein